MVLNSTRSCKPAQSHLSYFGVTFSLSYLKFFPQLASDPVLHKAGLMARTAFADMLKRHGLNQGNFL